MKIVETNLSDLIFAEYNPRQLSKDQFQQIKDSITRFGIVDPIIVNSNKDRKNIIIGGHQRVKVALEMGIDTVPCHFINLTRDKERELNIRLNKNTGEWDWEIVAGAFDVDELIEWGFSEDELQILQGGYDEEFTLPSGDREPVQQMTFTLADEQAEEIKMALKVASADNKAETFGNENGNGNALYMIVAEWLVQRK
jgi:hypothetical protein